MERAYLAPASNQERNDDQHNVALKRVVLFSSGVGYFEHAGPVRDDARVELNFNVDDVSRICLVTDGL